MWILRYLCLFICHSVFHFLTKNIRVPSAFFSFVLSLPSWFCQRQATMSTHNKTSSWFDWRCLKEMFGNQWKSNWLHKNCKYFCGFRQYYTNTTDIIIKENWSKYLNCLEYINSRLTQITFLSFFARNTLQQMVLLFSFCMNKHQNCWFLFKFLLLKKKYGKIL